MKGILSELDCHSWAVYLLLAVLTLTAACSPQLDLYHDDFPSKRCTYSDLRALDPVDAEQPSQDLLALYVDSTLFQYLLRLDFLDIQSEADYDIYITVDSGSGGNRSLFGKADSAPEWDVLISIPANGKIEVFDEDNRLMMNSPIVAMRNPSMDTIELSINKSTIPGNNPNPRIQVFSAPAGQDLISDSTEPVALHDSPPTRAPVLLAFWNSLPAYTPIQAMRRWSGAHIGPLGGRHGLYYLLKAAQDYQAPLVLLDLKSVPALPALDYLDVSTPIADLTRQGLLTLPEVSPLSQIKCPDNLSAWGVERAIQLRRQTSGNIALPASKFLYAASPECLPNSYPFVFFPTQDSGFHSSIHRYAGYRLLAIPQQDTTLQAGMDGPTLEIRRTLVEAAFMAGSAPGTIQVLGGDLAASTWGDPQNASATLRYLRAHPWIQLLDAQDLLAIHPEQIQPAYFTKSPDDPVLMAVLAALYETESNAAPISRPLVDNAWQSLLALSAPVAPSSPELANLRHQYLGQVASLLSAARWADQSTSSSDCSQDIDLDGVSECVLATHDVYLLFEKDSGSLVYAFTRDEKGVHQWLAPSSQFIVGQSDPNSWQMSAGFSADPAVIPGAFYDPETFTPLSESERITFQSPNLTKTYSILTNGLKIEYDSRPSMAPRLPLAIDPWLRSTRRWGDRYIQETDRAMVLGCARSIQRKDQRVGPFYSANL